MDGIWTKKHQIIYIRMYESKSENKGSSTENFNKTITHSY